jgi:hypothetical protein
VKTTDPKTTVSPFSGDSPVFIWIFLLDLFDANKGNIYASILGQFVKQHSINNHNIFETQDGEPNDSY